MGGHDDRNYQDCWWVSMKQFLRFLSTHSSTPNHTEQHHPKSSGTYRALLLYSRLFAEATNTKSHEDLLLKWRWIFSRGLICRAYLQTYNDLKHYVCIVRCVFFYLDANICCDLFDKCNQIWSKPGWMASISQFAWERINVPTRGHGGIYCTNKPLCDTQIKIEERGIRMIKR